MAITKTDAVVALRSDSKSLSMAYLYILNCADDTLYIGWTTNLDRRLHQHNAGRASRYTRARLPVRLVYWEQHPDRSSAMRREVELKRLPRAEKLRLIHTTEGQS